MEIGGPSRALWRPVPAAGRAGATPVALAVVLQTRRVADVRERDEGAPASDTAFPKRLVPLVTDGG